MKATGCLITLIIILVFSSQVSGQDNEITPAKKLQDFLESPLDIHAFKSKKGSSNSGGVRSEIPYFKPEQVGFHYQYMLFPTPANLDEGTRFGGFRLIVFKPGRVVGNYTDPGEKLVGLFCAYKDPDLKAANLVGVSDKEMEARFGAPAAKHNKFWHYYYKNFHLLLRFNQGKVDQFRYMKLKNDLPQAQVTALIEKMVEQEE